MVVVSSPRLAGIDNAYVHMLAEAASELPPIVVHRPTMRVVDGVHRLRAVESRGQDTIEARFFDGTEGDADLLSVAINVAQGMPLSLNDRIAAAGRIFAAHPRWSDRAVAAVAGLSAKKVAYVRHRTVGVAARCDVRVGRDGKARPLNSAHGRELARDLLRKNPDASLRQIARKAGISPATVADVRDRLSRGDDPVPEKQRRAAVVIEMSVGLPPTVERAARRFGTATQPTELPRLFDSLRKDPSLLLTESGRTVLRMLDACVAFTKDREKITVNLPQHCRGSVAQLVQAYAQAWQLFAAELQQEAPVLPQSG